MDSNSASWTRHSEKLEAALRLGDLIRSEILGGRYRPGEFLPSEAELSATHNQGRNVVRGALDLLRRDSYVVRRQGKGTFVVSRRRIHDLDVCGGVSSNFTGRGQRVFTRFCGTAEVAADPTVADKLSIEPGQPCVVISYETMIDREPYSIATSYLPHAMVGQRFEADLEGEWAGDWFVVLAALGLAVSRVDLCMEAVVADDSVASRLEIASGAPLIRFERLAYDADGRPLDYGFSRCRSDRIVLKAEATNVGLSLVAG